MFKSINYRPIALTSCLCKVVERMVNERLIWFLEKNKIRSRQQCGLRAHRGTTDHLVRLETFIRNAFVNREHTVCVFFDLQKAYDTTWKYGILSDLYDIGLRGNLPIFISNFLDDRTFLVLFATTMSDKYTQEEGVPQGAILSTTLFNIKINNITRAISPNINCSLYVDDFLMCYSSSSIIEIERQLQLSINKLEEWTLNNGFTISRPKTVAMHFCQLRGMHCDPTLFLGDQEIGFVKEAKFLGLTWDTKLTFLPHIHYLKKKCNKALNILKVLAHTDWGADQSTLLHLYRSLIRSKLDYGCFVYGSARESYIKQLNPILNQAMRLCLGAFRSSPADSLCVEANEPPLDYRRKKLALQYGVKLKANPSNPAYDLVFNPLYRSLFRNKPRVIPPFGIRLYNLLHDSDIDVDMIDLNSIPDVPNWDSCPPDTIFDLARFDKGTTLPYIYRGEFSLIESDHLDFCPIFTDGSKQDEKVACAFVTPYGTGTFRLPDHSSIFSAEAKAILDSLKYVKVSHLSKFIIYSDSLSLLQSIQGFDSKNPYICKIYEQLNIIHTKNKIVRFCWVPSHCGIPGNERADVAAKAALNKTESAILIPASDFKPKINQYILNIWQQYWSTQKHNKLFEIKPLLHDPRYSLRYRKDQIILNRLRIGHSRLTHSFLMDRLPLPVCPFCNSGDFLSIRHILLDCLSFRMVRRRHFVYSQYSDIFTKVSPSYIIDFVKEIGIYNKI